MSKTIFKYPVIATDVQTFEVPEEWQPLTCAVQAQTGGVFLWAIVDPAKSMRQKRCWVVGTGNPFPPEAEMADYIGTVQFFGGGLTFHVFVEP